MLHLPLVILYLMVKVLRAIELFGTKEVALKIRAYFAL